MSGFSLRQMMFWSGRREKEAAARIAVLRGRDGDNCRRCRRPIRFDLPRGHDKGPKLEPMLEAAGSAGDPLDNLCLCHGRCNAGGEDMTGTVSERLQRRSEAALLSKAKRARR